MGGYGGFVGENQLEIITIRGGVLMGCRDSSCLAAQRHRPSITATGRIRRQMKMKGIRTRTLQRISAIPVARCDLKKVGTGRNRAEHHEVVGTRFSEPVVMGDGRITTCTVTAGQLTQRVSFTFRPNDVLGILSDHKRVKVDIPGRTQRGTHRHITVNRRRPPNGRTGFSRNTRHRRRPITRQRRRTRPNRHVIRCPIRQSTHHREQTPTSPSISQHRPSRIITLRSRNRLYVPNVIIHRPHHRLPRHRQRPLPRTHMPNHRRPKSLRCRRRHKYKTECPSGQSQQHHQGATPPQSSIQTAPLRRSVPPSSAKPMVLFDKTVKPPVWAGDDHSALVRQRIRQQ